MSLFKIQKNNILIFLALMVVLAVSFFTNPSKSLAADCGVVSATFSPSGEQAEGWYDDEQQPNVVVDILTENCAGRTIEVSLTEADTGGGDDDLPDSGLDNRDVVVPTSNHIIMHLRAGEEACEAGPLFDCDYYITVYGLDTADYESQGETNGGLWYECDTACLRNWVVGQIYTPATGDSLPGDPDETFDIDTGYELLAPLPGLGSIDTLPSDTNPCPFGKYLNIIIRLFLGICAVLAMVMIVAGGIEYMTSELGSSKEAGKGKITHAILGLILALGAYAILNTLNPQLLGGICLNRLPEANITIADNFESSGAFQSINNTVLQAAPFNVTCPTTADNANLPLSQYTRLRNVANSFNNKATYSQTNRNTYDSTVPTIFFDCSSYVKQVYACAGQPLTGNNTTEIFNSSGVETITSGPVEDGGVWKVNGQTLKAGDLIGWKPENGESGHVIMYYGSGNSIEVTSPANDTNNAVKIRNVNHWGSRLKYIKRVPL